MRLNQLFAFAFGILMVVACSSSHKQGANDMDDSLSTQVEQQEQEAPIQQVLTRDLDFMIFLHNFTHSEAYQWAHIKFPLGKLTYAMIDTYDGQEPKFDQYKKSYWCLRTGFVVAKDLSQNCCFSWKSDDEIVYNESYEEWGGGSTYTFKKQDGEWYVVKGDYWGSDVGTPEVCLENAEFSARTFHENVKGDYALYSYQGTPGRYPQASDRRLTEQDLEGLSSDELAFMRNEIVARHGYAFSSAKWMSKFVDEPWYSPLFNKVDNNLSDIERENIAFIKSHE